MKEFISTLAFGIIVAFALTKGKALVNKIVKFIKQ